MVHVDEMWPVLPQLKHTVEFAIGFELERFYKRLRSGYHVSWARIGRRVVRVELSSALELSRDDDCANCLLEFEFAGCFLCVLLEHDND